VRVKRGLLTGANGTLTTKNEQHMFLFTIEPLGRRGSAVNVAAGDLEAA
jgi:hypothetical protein